MAETATAELAVPKGFKLVMVPESTKVSQRSLRATESAKLVGQLPGLVESITGLQKKFLEQANGARDTGLEIARQVFQARNIVRENKAIVGADWSEWVKANLEPVGIGERQARRYAAIGRGLDRVISYYDKSDEPFQLVEAEKIANQRDGQAAKPTRRKQLKVRSVGQLGSLVITADLDRLKGKNKINASEEHLRSFVLDLLKELTGWTPSTDGATTGKGRKGRRS